MSGKIASGVARPVQVSYFPDTRVSEQRESSSHDVGIFRLLVRVGNRHERRQDLDVQCVLQRLGRGPVLETITLMRAPDVVAIHELIEAALDLGNPGVPGLSSLCPEAFIEQRAVHALDEAVGAR